MKKNRKITLIVVTVVLFLIIGIVSYSSYIKKQNEIREQERLEELQQKQELLEDIKSHYSESVITNSDAVLYKKVDNDYIESGYISKDIILDLELYKELNVEEHIYFKLKSFDLYIRYDTVSITAKINQKNTYHNYIPFNENIVSKKFYVDENRYYEFEDEQSIPVIIKDGNKYYGILDDKLVYANINESNVVSNQNTTKEIATGVAVLNYHYVISVVSGEHLECLQSICHTDTQFDSHMNYIASNGFYTVTMEDLELYIDGKIQLPKKSVAITIDDGWYVGRAIPILEKYKLQATLFLIGKLAPPSAYVSDYLEVHSHTWDLHTPGICVGGQGAPIKCLERNTILEDLRKSRESLNNTTVFCWPFYEYNDYAISLVKEAGFTMAFGGTNMKVTPGVNKYKIPRYGIINTTSVDYIARIIN